MRNNAMLIGLTVLTLIAGVALWHRSSIPVAPAAPAHAAFPAVPHRYSVLFVGDNFTGGTGASSWNAYSCVLARQRGWNCNLDTQGGTGYLNDGRAYGTHRTQRLIDRIERDARLYQVDMVFLDAGRSDLGYPPDTIAAGAANYLITAAKTWPKAKIVVLLPFYLAADPYPNYEVLTGRFAAAVAAVRGTLIDPYAEHWFSGVAGPAMVGKDGSHPNALGNEFLANRIDDSLTRHGLSGGEP